MNRSDDGDCIASWCADDEWCAVTCTAHLIGRKCHPVIVHRLLENGPLGFNALRAEIEAISGTVLSNSLEDLEDHGLVDRMIVDEKPFRVQYSFTDQGSSLRPVIVAMDEWGPAYLADTDCRS